VDPEFLELEVQAIAGELEPTPEQKQGAQRSQRAIRAALDSGNMAARIVDDYLIGSYARHTAITPLDDVDIMFLIDPSEWNLPLFGDKPEPQKVLDTFARAIRLRYDQSQVVVQRRSVGLKMNHLDIDAVPAIQTDREHYVLIPDRKEDQWVLTAPRVHAHRVTEVNDARSGLFVPLVKMVKGWNSQLPQNAALKSFTVETMALRIFAKTQCSSLFEGCLKFFDFLSGRYNEETVYRWENDFGVGLGWLCLNYELGDVAGTGANLLSGLSEDRRTAFLKRALTARDLLVKAESARSEETCAGYLGSAFGW
jgi:hypothetical protein